MARNARDFKQTKLCTRLLRKLQDVGVELPTDGEFALQGLSPGWAQKAAGAWSWQLWYRAPLDPDWHAYPIGGDDPASEMVKTDAIIDTYHTSGGLAVCITNSKRKST